MFVDRGIPDVYAYAEHFCCHVTDAIEQAVKQYRYNHLIFISPPWLEIYKTDTERKHDFIETNETYDAIKRAHIDCGYYLRIRRGSHRFGGAGQVIGGIAQLHVRPKEQQYNLVVAETAFPRCPRSRREHFRPFDQVACAYARIWPVAHRVLENWQELILWGQASKAFNLASWRTVAKQYLAQGVNAQPECLGPA